MFTTSPKRADPVPGPRPAPELARYDQIHAERDGVRAPATPPAAPGAALGVLAGVLDRDGQQHSATQTRQQALADADHLAVLHAIWTAETTPARQQRYRDLLAAALPPEHHRGTSHQARWLWRTLRGAELAGLDPAQVLADAIGERDLAGSRDLAAVLDTRIRYRLGALVPLPAGPWSAQVPAITDPGRRAYVTEIAALMDARKDRIGEHAAEHALPWAVNALGPVPEHPLDRLDWQKRAASIGAWRELSGYHHPAEPIGPEPAAAAPDLRAAWHEALAALGPRRRAGRPRHARRAAAAPARHLPHRNRLGTPVRRRRAPPGPRRRLDTPAWPPSAPAPKPKPPPAAASTTTPLSSNSSATATRPCTRPTGTARPSSPPSWPTGPTGTPPPAPSATWPWPPTPNSAAATPNSTTRRCARPNPSPPPRPSATSSPCPSGQPIPEIGQWIKDLAATHHTFADRLAERQSMTVPSEDPDYGDLGQAFPPWPGPARDAILQPPKPEIRPSPRVLQRAADRDADPEAAD